MKTDPYTNLIAATAKLLDAARKQFDQSATCDGLANCDLLAEVEGALYYATEDEP